MSEANREKDGMKGENLDDSRERLRLERKYQHMWSSTPIFTL